MASTSHLCHAAASYRTEYVFLHLTCTILAERSRLQVGGLKVKESVGVVFFGRKITTHDLVALAALPPEAKIVASGKVLEDFLLLTEADWAGIEVLVTLTTDATGIKDVLRKAIGVKWIHSLSCGVCHLVRDEVKTLNVSVTNGRGHSSHALAEYALSACNYFAKDFPRLLASKATKKWDVFKVEELRGRTMGIIGLGDIGFSTAKIAKAFGMKIIGVRRNLTLTEDEKLIVDAVYSPEDTAKVMGMSDYVVAALPLTAKTNKLINSTCFNAMQSHAVFINIGRGPTVDEAALVKVLQDEKIRGAALDVFEVEPLSQTSPLYKIENVLISSHNAHFTVNTMRDVFHIFVSLMEKYINGEELYNFVHLDEGY